MTLAMKYDELRKEGLAEGKAVGLAEGKKVGRTEGIEQTKIATAKNFINMNILSDDQIALGTGLSLEQIQTLKEEIFANKGV